MQHHQAHNKEIGHNCYLTMKIYHVFAKFAGVSIQGYCLKYNTFLNMPC